MNRQGPGKIEYLHYDWNVVRGCRHQEMGLCNVDCYVPRNPIRFGIPKGVGRTPERIEQVRRAAMKPRFVESELEKPLGVKAPSRIGVCYTGDLFGSWVPAEWIERVLDVCRRAHWHRFLLLTKNPARYAEFDIPGNCWCGTSCETGREQQRIDDLLSSSPEGRRFVSLEPFQSPKGFYKGPRFCELLFFADWFIVGGQTGKNQAPAPRECTRELCYQVELQRKPVFIKSNTGYAWKIQQYPDDLRLG